MPRPMSGGVHTDRDNRFSNITRRRVLTSASAGLLGSIGIAGCVGGSGNPDSSHQNNQNYDHNNQRARNVDTPITPDGTSWDELPTLSGELTIYSGRTEDQIDPVLRQIDEQYDDLTVEVRYDSNEAHLSTIREEGANSPADLLYTQDSGSLGALKEMGRTVTLTEDILGTVPANWRDPDGTWTGVSGRVMSVLYNTDVYSADDLPNDLFEYPHDERFQNDMAWRVDSGSFLAFVRALMIEHGDGVTKTFIEEMQAAGIEAHEGGSTTPTAVALGEVSIGFTNHYYGGRYLDDHPDAPLNIHFTDGDLGSLFNVSGVAVLDSSNNQDLARDFARHLLSIEGQEFFVETNKEYAVIPGVEYAHEQVPTLEEINYPDFDLNQLSDVEPAVDLLREVGYR